MFDLNGKKVLVIGSPAPALRRPSFVRATKRSSPPWTHPRIRSREIAAKLRAAKISLQLGGYTEKILDGHDLVIPSPRVPADSAILKRARQQHSRLSEIELADRFLHGRSLASLAPTEKPRPLLSSNIF